MNHTKVKELAALFCNPLVTLSENNFKNLLALESADYQLFLDELDKFQKPEEIATRKKNMKRWLSQSNQNLSQLEVKLSQLESETFQSFVKEKVGI